MRLRQLAGSVLTIALSSLQATPAFAADARTAGMGSRVAVDINGERQLVTSVEGGSAVGTVATNGTDKHITGAKYEDIVVSIPATSIPAAVKDALDGKPSRVSGGIDYVDYDYKSERRIGFKNAIISAIRFPALDASSKDAANVDLVLSPESTKDEAPGGDLKGALGSKQQKRALTGMFRVTIPDIDAKRVSAVSAIEVRAKGTDSAAGADRFATKDPGTFDVPNIKLTISAADIKPWQQWLDKTLAGGNDQERKMTIELLDPTLKESLLTIDLSGVGIVAVRMKKSEANADAIQRAEVELYAEQVKLGGGKVAAAEPAPADSSKTTETVAKDAAIAAPQRTIRRAR